ncbi:MAG: ribosomal small subunit methyltransferase, partial [Bacillota bacterium]
MMLRIIAGKFRSRKLLQPSLKITRPTKDRVREAIFSAIGPKIIDAVVLDLFAGSGAFGFEALSRGARFVYINDHNPDAIKIIEANKFDLKIEETKISQLDALQFIQYAVKNKIQFDIVFLDPPYAYSELQ